MRALPVPRERQTRREAGAQSLRACDERAGSRVAERRGEEESLWRAAPRAPCPRPQKKRKGKVVYASMKVALGRRGSVGPSLPLLAALVAAIAALLLAYNASPARAADGNCSTNAGTTTCTFASTGSEQTFRVPDGVSTVRVVAIGAPGAVGLDGGNAGRGARVSGDLTGLTPGDALYVEVGGAPTGGGTCGNAACIGGFNGGGSSFFGGGGGGASDVRTVARDQSASLGSRLIVAGGGGGSGFGASLTCFDVQGGRGGDAGADGGAGDSCDNVPGGTGGKAGSQSAGGAGGF